MGIGEIWHLWRGDIERKGRLSGRSGLELDHRYLLAVEADIADPFRVHLLLQHDERPLAETGTGAMEPKIAARLAEDALVGFGDLLVADAARVDGRRIGIVGVEDHRLLRRVRSPGHH